MGHYHFDWNIILQYKFKLLAALGLSAEISGAALVIGLCVGLFLAYLSTCNRRPVNRIALTTVHAVRNTPLLLLTFFGYLLLPQLGVRVLSSTTTFALALSISTAAAASENFRAAFVSLPCQYRDAGRAIGLVMWQRELFVVFPIAVRSALPSLTNTAVATFKDSSLASIISVRELTYTAQEISTDYFRVFEAWIVVGAMYLLASSLIGLAGRLAEARFPRLSSQ